MPPPGNRAWAVLLSDALYRRLLVLYPKAFRSEYGTEMAQVFRDRMRDQYRSRGNVGVLALWPAALRDLLTAAAAEHLVGGKPMARRIVALAGGLALLTFIVLNIALPQAMFPLDLIVGGVLNVASFLPVMNVLLVVYGLVHSLPLALILATLAFQFCLLLLWRQQIRPARVTPPYQPWLRQVAAMSSGEPQMPPSEQRHRNRRQRPHPLGVSVWLLLQYLFLNGVYYSILFLIPGPEFHALVLLRVNRYIYPFLPRLTVLPDPHFLWLQGAYSLLTADPWHVLPVAATVLTVLALYLALRRALTMGRDARQRLRSILAISLTLLGVALLTLFIGLAYPAGVALSWGISMLFVAARHTAQVARSP